MPDQLSTSYKSDKTLKIVYNYYMNDQINSTRMVIDGNGDVVYSSCYSPFGAIQEEWVNTYDPQLKFSGKERNSYTGWDYFGARYYDHKSYRFTSVDPIINKENAINNPQLWNLYSYCRNNPITYLDPDGRKLEFAPGSSNKFKNQIAQARKYLADSNVARILLSNIDKHPMTVILRESYWHITGYDPKTKTLWLDPTSGLKLGDGSIQSPALGLIHEIDHAFRHISDHIQFWKDKRKKVPEFLNLDDIKAILGTEYPVAKDLGEPIRTRHNEGVPIKVKNITYKKNKQER